MTQPNTENTGVENVETHETTSTETTPKEMSAEELKAELSRVRNEAASRRIENRELKEQADKWKAYEDSQKTELQKLQEALAEKDKMLSGYELDKKRSAVAKEFGLDVEDADLLTGSDEATIRTQAERLKARLGTATNQRPVDLLAGNRGTPIGGSNTNSVDEMIRRMAGH